MRVTISLSRILLGILCLFVTNAMANGSVPDASALPSLSDSQAAEGHKAKDYSVGGALDIVGNVTYTISNTNRTVAMTADRIVNNSTTTTSGSIRLRIIVTTAPITGGFTYWTLGEISLNPLSPNFQYSNVSGTVPLAAPPDGIYYIHIGVFEFEGTCGSASGYCADDIITFNGRVQVIGGVFYDYAPDVVSAVEYFHGTFGHYFVTASPDEIAALDAGVFQGWSRTGQTFQVWTAAAAGRVGVCRFFTVAFAPKSSHFYTPYANECAIVRTNPVWQYEGVVAYMVLATSGGACPTGVPLYRLYNNGLSGAPNHRYTTSLAIRSAMIAQGWIPEGAGALGVIACIPV